MLVQPRRIAVPVQSFPVSPPPRTITCLSFAVMKELSVSFESKRLFVTLLSQSTANIIPSTAFPSISVPAAESALAFFAPQHKATASYLESSSSASSFVRISFPVTNSTPSFFISSTRRSIIFLSSFMFGIPYIKSPPILSSLSKTVTLWPRRLSKSATARPLGPEPTTATRFSLRVFGI